jgi:hypothetical protein
VENIAQGTGATVDGLGDIQAATSTLFVKI